MNYWFVARANELFIDTDNASKSAKHARARLQGAIECGKLDVAYVISRPSKSKDHWHTIITLKSDMSPFSRFAWEIVLHGDIYRGCCNIMRELHNRITVDGKDTIATSILISPHPLFHHKEFDDKINDWFIYNREPDDSCECKSKHTRAAMETCPAAVRLRGENRTRGFFGKPSKNPCTIWPEPFPVKEIVERMKKVRKPFVSP